MNSRRIWLLAILMIFAWRTASGDDLKPIRELGGTAWHAFEQHQTEDGRRYYEDFLQKVAASSIAVRDTQIQVVLGVLGCALPEHRTMGQAVLDLVLQSGKGITQIRSTLESVRDACAGSTSVPVLPSATWKLVTVSASSGIGVSGKGGDPSMHPVASIAVSQISQAELDKRLELTADPAKALPATLARFGREGAVTDHFIVAVDNGTAARAQGIVACLEKYRADLISEFDMEFPSHPITVYDTAWDEMVYELAPHLHGLQLAPGTIAYSVYGDLSMAGAGSPEACGSLAHELTHLMIKGNFGDAPPWLEEGLASAVALSTPGSNHVIFEPGWRERVLRSKWNMRPSVDELLHLTWDDFSPSNSIDLSHEAAIQAMASVFVRYLSAKKKLDSVYAGVRKQDPLADANHRLSPRQVLEKEMGKTTADVDKDFVAWFEKQYPEPAPSGEPRGTARPCKPGEKPSPMKQEAPCREEREPEIMNQANRPPG
jgi:hypothetical protein